MDTKFTTTTFVMLGVALSVICSIFLFLYIREVIKTYKKRLEVGNPRLIKYKHKLESNTMSRHEVIDGYMISLLYYHSKMKDYMESNKWFKLSIYPTACAQKLKSDATELFKCVCIYLSSDIDDYLSGDNKEICEREMKMFTHMLSDISKFIINNPKISLQLYSNYFCQLLIICQYITEGVMRKHMENSAILTNIKLIENLLKEFKPIAMFYDGSNKSDKEIKKKINEKYVGRIKELKNMKDIWEVTFFLVFDDIVIFTEKFYAEMDIIKQSIQKNNQLIDLKKINN